MGSWNKLWGASRCGDLHLHHQDSDRFVWKRASLTGHVIVAAYSYDSGVKPYNPPNSNLLQPFATPLLADGKTSYRFQVELPAANATTFVLSSAGGVEIERKIVVHKNACANWYKGYHLSLYYGGQCTAPSRVEVCYANESTVASGM